MAPFKFAVFSEALENEETYIGKLLVYPRVYRKIFPKIMENGGCPMLNTSVEADDTHQRLHRIAREKILKWKWVLEKWVEKGKEAGEISSEISPQKVAELMIILFEGGGAMTKVSGQESFMLHAIDQVETLIESIRV